MARKDPLEVLRLVTASVILALFVVSVIVGIMDGDYEPPWTLHVMMVAIAGYLFGPSIVGRATVEKRQRNGDEKP